MMLDAAVLEVGLMEAVSSRESLANPHGHILGRIVICKTRGKKTEKYTKIEKRAHHRCTV